MHKIQPPGGEGTSELRVCGKSTTNEKEENVTATSTKVLTSEEKVAGSLLISIQSWRRNQTYICASYLQKFCEFKLVMTNGLFGWIWVCPDGLIFFRHFWPKPK